MILEIFPCWDFQTNAMLLACSETKRGVFIDPAPESHKVLIKAMKKHAVTVEAIYLTHSHFDHIGDVPWFKRELNLPVYVHELDAPNLRKPGSDGIPLPFKVENVEPDGFLKDGQVLHVGNLELKVIHTPGHSPGGVCFYIEKENVLISGDTLFQGTIGNLSLPTAEPEKMWESLKKLSQFPSETKVYPGHGSMTTIGDEPWLGRAKEIF